MELPEVKERLKSVKKETRRFGIRTLGIFGSYARGEQDKKSDLDLAADFDKTPSLLQLARAERFLSDTTGIKVDLVCKKGLEPRFLKKIGIDMVMV